ncbi:unnamed protein product, partial [Polarella glacialis]
RYGDAPRLCFHAIDPGTVDTKLMRQGASTGSGKRKGRGLRQGRLKFGWAPNVQSSKVSFEALVDDSFQTQSGRTLESPPEVVFDKKARTKLWEDLVELSGATWPDTNPGPASLPPA